MERGVVNPFSAERIAVYSIGESGFEPLEFSFAHLELALVDEGLLCGFEVFYSQFGIGEVSGVENPEDKLDLFDVFIC